MNANRPTRAFTLIELLAAVTITLIMLALINKIFFETTEAVSLGVATSEIIGQSRAVNDQIDRDFHRMLPPKSTTGVAAGFLVIVNQQYSSLAVKAGGEGDVTRDAAGANPPKVRSDQIAFIMDSNGVESITPDANNTFNSGMTGPYARVWLGHALRTKRDGTSDASAVLGHASLNEGRNALSNTWVLGRQAMLLAGSSATTNHVDGIYWNHSTTAHIASMANFRGIADVSDMVLFSTDAVPPAITLPGAPLLTNDATQLVARLRPDMTAAAYRDEIRQFTACGYNVADNRLQCNPLPPSGSYTSEHIARMHPFLAGNVSDFIVEFAGDYENNSDGSISPDGFVDVVRSAQVPGTFPTGTIGNIKWYSKFNDPTNAGVTSAITSNAIFTGATTSDPLYTSLDADRGDFVFRHNDTTRWPHLIRIRYRMHDTKGRLRGKSPDSFTSGKWFELILRIPRD